ncbi:MAG: hypothetical protein AVDCRST_MAG59-2290 [uncultured Thermomicrobiales bacterium]|uniref:Uncharacterized protein n=1 Tax=uncultured Thermomicrobiales bacterium TaxID=1645740 RepID=A0A6J4UQN2_9BACT|nr:MAG: hypothetical protein AVDCRST_MAG59-2290 [uncultured Thermomicrobiales bacterium]
MRSAPRSPVGDPRLDAARERLHRRSCQGDRIRHRREPKPEGMVASIAGTSAWR